MSYWPQNPPLYTVPQGEYPPWAYPPYPIADQLQTAASYPKTFLAENHAIYFKYLPEYVGAIGYIEMADHDYFYHISGTDMATITLGFNPENAVVMFTDGEPGADSVTVSLVSVSGQPAFQLQWDVVSPSGRPIQARIFEVVT